MTYIWGGGEDFWGKWKDEVDGRLAKLERKRPYVWSDDAPVSWLKRGGKLETWLLEANMDHGTTDGVRSCPDRCRRCLARAELRAHGYID
jgi:hypothetical protein